MKTNFEIFNPIGSQELLETNGGGFAHDMGRVLRFLAIALPGTAISVTNAITDWQINAAEV
jgi:hypothetical protein